MYTHATLTQHLSRTPLALFFFGANTNSFSLRFVVHSVPFLTEIQSVQSYLFFSDQTNRISDQNHDHINISPAAESPIVRMGSVAIAVEEDKLGFDARETIFVAVGKRVEQSERALLWAVNNFSGKSLCVLHVHRPSRLLAMSEFFFFFFFVR